MRKYRANGHFKAFDELIFAKYKGIFRFNLLFFALKNPLGLSFIADGKAAPLNMDGPPMVF